MDDVSTCPGCGAELSYTVQEARVLTGTCSSCQRVTTLIEGTIPLGTAAPGGTGDSSTVSEGSASGPECADCGGTLTVTAGEDGKLEVACAECETTTVFVPEGSPPPRSGPDRGERFDRPRRREMPGGEGPSRSRPCRQCGAPLAFTTDENGNLTGECSSCGNRFTLPPRRDGPPGRDRPSAGRYGARGPPRYGRDNRGWSGGNREGRPRYGSSSNYRRRDSDGDGGDDDRRRRRPRRE